MSSINYKKTRKTNCFRHVFGLFCCLKSPDHLENVSFKQPATTSIAIQCNIQNELAVEQNHIRNVSDKDMSLEKIDSLIINLNNILQTYITETKICTPTNTEKNYAAGEDVYKNTTDTSKGENLPLIDKSDRLSSLPIIRRSHSEFSRRNNRSRIKCKETKSSDSVRRNSMLQLPISIGQFTTNIIDNLTTLKTDIGSLKNLFGNFKTLIMNPENTYVHFARGGLKNCFRSNDRWIMKSEGFIDAKTSVENFCKFYKMGRKCKKRSKIPIKKAKTPNLLCK